MLFQWDLSGLSPAEVLDLFWESNPTDSVTQSHASYLFDTMTSRQEEIDRLIEETASNWRLARMSAVDRNVIRLAVAEMLLGDSPAAVVLDEAVEIARKYGAERSSEFVNGVLDRVKEKVRSLA